MYPTTKHQCPTPVTSTHLHVYTTVNCIAIIRNDVNTDLHITNFRYNYITMTENRVYIFLSLLFNAFFNKYMHEHNE